MQVVWDQTLHIDIKHVQMDNWINIALLVHDTGLVVRSDENHTGKNRLSIDLLHIND